MMADEERNETAEETAEETPATEEAAAEAPAEEAADAPEPATETSETEQADGDPAAPGREAEEAAAEAPAEDAADATETPETEQADGDPDVPGSEAEEASGSDGDAEPLTPKQLRKLARSRASGRPRPQRDASERVAERAQRREATAASRRRYRRRGRERQGESGEGTTPAEWPPGPKKVRLGRVVSTKGDKTITVQIELARRHPTYEKVVRRSATLHAHDAENTAAEGDTVRVVETRPLSKLKRWRLLEIVERAR